jgi:hypothetical protein
LESAQYYEEERKKAETLSLQWPHRFAEIHLCENATGDRLTECRNAKECYDSFSNEDVAYSTILSTCKDTFDFDIGGYDSELCLELVGSGIHINSCVFGVNSNCFGCCSLQKKEYCILNKQYTKEEYESLVPTIITKMRADGEWGEYFPVRMSPFAYNETVAKEEFPLTKEQIESSGFAWKTPKEDIPRSATTMPAASLPDRLAEAPAESSMWIITCEETARPFRFIKQEIEFYKMMQLPLPHLHPDVRHMRRLARRNPRTLFTRNCSTCDVTISTTFAPERKEIVVCEACYLKEVY